MEQSIPFPPPPLLGWYREDAAWAKAHEIELEGAQPAPHYVLRNTLNGQEIELTKNTLLGRKPSRDVAGEAAVVTLFDSTRTVSRNHVFVRFGEDGSLWLKDLGSLNGTFISKDGGETRLEKNVEVQALPGALIRMGDEFYHLEQFKPAK